MTIAWFICPYKRRSSTTRPVRYCAMDDYTQRIIYQDGGNWSESEVLGNHAVVKVKASDLTLSTIAGETGFIRLPKAVLTESLADLTAQQKTAIRNKLESLGYPLQEILDALGNDIGSKTLADVLRFVARRRLKPRYDEAIDSIILDGLEQPVRSIESVDEEVR